MPASNLVKKMKRPGSHAEFISGWLDSLSEMRLPGRPPTTVLHSGAMPLVQKESSHKSAVVRIFSALVAFQKDAESAAERVLAAADATDTAPTEAQKHAGNYRKGAVRLMGMQIAIENPAGSQRSGVDRKGKAWRTTLKHHYGYIRRTEGADGDHVDVFINPAKPESFMVYVINQVDPATGRFDEHKAMLGFRTKDEAIAAYRANYQRGWKGAGSVTSMPVGQFKRWLAKGDLAKPAVVLREKEAAGAHGDMIALVKGWKAAALEAAAKVAKGTADAKEARMAAQCYDLGILKEMPRPPEKVKKMVQGMLNFDN